MTKPHAPSAPTWILDESTPIALLISAEFQPEQTTFLTQPDMDQQLGILVHPKGMVVKRHKHVAAPRPLTTCPECLILRKGSCRVDLYGLQDQLLANLEMGAGDILIILQGGHEFTMLEACEWIETRAGRYPGDQAKVFF